MLIADMIHSCSNDKVAQAAVACIGGHFAERVRAAAHERGLNAGRFVASVMRDFALRANEETRAILQRKIAGADQPLLDGLRQVVEGALEDGPMFFDDDPQDFGSQFVWSGRCSASAWRFQ
ncbi:MAG: hypothetical protein HYS06_03255 [Methylocystis sp.]|nr:hypothetical protein [Methylocystis sp.]MBI3276116.1 hypothetical protein [Methylocystis sp.]